MATSLAPALRRLTLCGGARFAALHRVPPASVAVRAFLGSSLSSLNGPAARFAATRWQSTSAAAAHFQFSAEDDLAFGAGDDKDSKPAPTLDTLEGKVSDETLKGLRDMGITRLSPVQEAVFSHLPELAIPISQRPEGSTATRDLLVKARTGTGKTVGFLVPAIEMRKRTIEAAGLAAVKEAGDESDTRLCRQAERTFARRNVGTLIISPTRELATQLAAEAIRVTKHHGMEVRLFTGGTNKSAQMRDFTRGRRDIVVATTGRLRDLLQSEPDVRAAFAKMDLLVLDETDTLLDQGFRDDLDAIGEFLPNAQNRQTLLFSATVPRNVQQVARAFMHPQHEVIDCIKDDTPPVHAHVPQHYTLLPNAKDQVPHLLRLIAHDQMVNPGTSKVIVFLPTLKLTQLFATILRGVANKTVPAGSATRIHELHSKLAQNAHTSGAAVMVTSDVSARGVDYPNVSRVIQIGIPSSAEQYIHRIGRTGRAGSKGVNPRGDFILQNWESGFLTWQLTDIPIKPSTVAEIKDEVADLAAKFDAGELTLPESERPGHPTRLQEAWAPSASAVVKDIDPQVAQLLRRVDESAVRETFLSMIGFYASKGQDLRMEKTVLVEALQQWTVDAMGLPQPPYVSPGFLRDIGMGEGQKRHRDRPDQRRGGNDRRLSKPWVGRGAPMAEGGRDRRSYGGRDEHRPSRYGQDSDGGRRRYDGGDSRTSRYDRDSDRGQRRPSFDGGERREQFNPFGRGRRESGEDY
ncbi:P-loop containing nucleoside triphosphate hydrolase protein [Schizophyllum amplum]|uniref:ATP-dependent RNA helicase n=1 Tax=Schizophyllum amplum TaxID=97359 RepID=A0A550C6R0_9AGAR|nr:P-loop containing nucleoside triphosphate hydrolase protein [Auriculariopsis ampla]